MLAVKSAVKFFQNRGGAYVRTKITPANGQTARQSFVRQLLGAISQSWSGLTQSARDSFDGAGLRSGLRLIFLGTFVTLQGKIYSQD